MEKISDYLAEEGRLSFRGGIFPYAVYGKGRPVLFFQSLCPEKPDFDLLLMLCQSYRVIVPGVPEQPRDDPNVMPPEYDGLADRTAYLLWRMEIEHLPVIGVAAGACMAMVFAELYGRIPYGLAILDPILHPGGLQPGIWLDFVRKRVKKEAKKEDNRYYPMTPDSIHVNKTSLTSLSCPLLLSFSTPGPVRRRHQATIKSALPTGEVTLCEGAVFQERLMQFLIQQYKSKT